MSAINIVVQRDAAHIITDGAAYAIDGILHAAINKVMTVPHLGAAIGVRGPALALACLGADIGMRFASFDAVVAGLADEARDLVAKYSSIWQDDYPVASIEIYLVGWSDERESFEAYTMRTVAADMEFAEQNYAVEGAIQSEPFELLRLDAVSAIPGFDVNELAETGYAARSADAFDPEIDGRRVLEVQRQICAPLAPDMPATHHVGCFAQRTTIRRGSIEQVIFHRWDDQIGEPIQPGPLDYEGLSVLRRDVSGFSRLQRQRMDKKARKGTLRAV